ncbi:MAG: hypothetical protein AAB420_01250 [Patescibacteria group bacterium]
MRWFFIFVVLISFTTAVFFFGKPSPNEPAHIGLPESRSYVITYRDGVFSPTNLRIRSRDSITFRNDSLRVIAIPEFNSGEISPRGDYTRVFSTPGVYSYTNQFQPKEDGMIIVQ